MVTPTNAVERLCHSSCKSMNVSLYMNFSFSVLSADSSTARSWVRPFFDSDLSPSGAMIHHSGISELQVGDAVLARDNRAHRDHVFRAAVVNSLQYPELTIDRCATGHDVGGLDAATAPVLFGNEVHLALVRLPHMHLHAARISFAIYISETDSPQRRTPVMALINSESQNGQILSRYCVRGIAPACFQWN